MLHIIIGISRGGSLPGGTFPLDRLKCILFFGVIMFTSLEVSCQIGLLINVSIAGDQRMCGKNRAGLWIVETTENFCYYPPPPH